MLGAQRIVIDQVQTFYLMGPETPSQDRVNDHIDDR